MARRPLNTCRVCGKAYPACRTCEASRVFHYRTVACSPECGAAYLAGIMASRESPPRPDTEKENQNGNE